MYETVPEGYQKTSGQPSFCVTVDTDGNYTVNDISSGAGTISTTKLIQPGGEGEGKVTGVLVRNVPEKIAATITKVWECEPEESVTMVLTGTTETESKEYGSVVLNESNNWTYTWNDLPLVLGNQVVNYTIQETKIDTYEFGSDAFLHWIPQYITPVYKDEEGNVLRNNGTQVSDEDAYKVRSVDFEIRNDAQDVNDVTLKLIKKDASDQTKQINGAVFQIYEASNADNAETIYYNNDPIRVKNNGYVRTFSGLDLKFHYNRDYYIREIEAPEGYAVLDGFIRIHVEPTGHIEVGEESEIMDYVQLDTEHNLVAELTVLDIPMEIKMVKTVMGSRTPLAGAHFSMYAVTGDTVSEHPVAGFEDIVTGEDGIIYTGGLPLGIYELVETQAPDGYMGLEDPIRITVTTTGIIAFLNSSASRPMAECEETTVQNGERTDVVKRTYVVQVPNSTGYELPSTGGPGIRLIYLIGSILMAFALAGLLLTRRRNTKI